MFDNLDCRVIECRIIDIQLYFEFEKQYKLYINTLYKCIGYYAVETNLSLICFTDIKIRPFQTCYQFFALLNHYIC